MSGHMRPALMVLTALSASACGGNFTGDYAGDVHVTYTPAKAGEKGVDDVATPVHVIVTKADSFTFEIKGAPFSSCKLPVVSTHRNGIEMLVGAGVCSFSVNSATATMPKGAFLAFLTGDTLQFTYNPSTDDGVFATFSFTGKRSS